jgi:excisionase family DNA binding protein
VISRGGFAVPLTAPPIRPGALGYPEAAEYLAVGLTTLKKLVRNGELQAIHVGRRAIVPLQALDDYLQRQLESAR